MKKPVFTLILMLCAPIAFAQHPGDGVWANYDFVPGHRVLAFHDFEDTYTGNFPDRVEYLQGDMEVVQLSNPDTEPPNQVLRTQNEGRFIVPAGAALPEKFTLEFRLMATDQRARAMVYSPMEKAPIKSPGASLAALVEPQASGLSVGKYTDGPKATQKLPEHAFLNKWVDVRIAVDGTYWKMYVDEKRVANIPQADFPRTDGLAFYFSVYPYDGGAVYLDDIRIAEGGRSMLYEELSAKGSVVTHGLLFDFNSATLRPESTPTLLDIARMMNQHKDLKLRIEGHTDNTGSDDVNAMLSKQRAESVQDWLIRSHQIDASRLTTDGLGATRPTASNDTPEGRQENRRVELHKM